MSLDHEQTVRSLEKENRILRRQLEQTQADLKVLEDSYAKQGALLTQIIQDLSESREALSNRTEELETAVAQLRQQAVAMDAASDGIAILREGHCVYLNKAQVDIFGYADAAELLGQPWQILYRSDEVQRLEQDVIPLLQQQGYWRGEAIACRKDGSTFFEEISLTLIEDGSLIAVCCDITDRKQAEEELRQLNLELEQRVAERTYELSETVSQLQREITDRAAIEEALRESKQLLQLVFDSIPQRIFWKDRNSVFLGCNQNFAQVAGGRSPDDIIGKTDYDMPWTREEADWYRDCDRQVMEAGVPQFHIIETQQTADGKTIWADTSKIPLHDGEGRVIGILGTYEDITERKQIEATLQEQEQFLRSIYEGVGCLIFVVDVVEKEQFRYSSWSKSAEQATGLPPSAVLGKTPEDVFDPVQGARVRQNYCHCVGTAAQVTYEEQLLVNGRETWWLTTLNPIKNTADEIYRIVGTSVDITDRKTAEAALEGSQAELLALFQAMQDVILVYSSEGRYEKIAPTGAHLLYRPAADVLGKTLSEVLPPEMSDPCLAAIRQTLATKTVVKLDYSLPLGDRDAWFEASVAPLTDETVVWIARDISDRKRMEEQLRQQAHNLEQAFQELQQTQSQMIQAEKMSSLGQLVAGVAHEINNPVNFIYGNLSHLDEYIQDLLNLIHLYEQHGLNQHPMIQNTLEAIDLEFIQEDLPKLLSSMRVGTDRIRQIVLSLRNFSRMDEAEFKAVDVHDGIDSTLMILQHRLKDRPERPGIQITKEYGPLPLVECYPGQLNQVFMNILSNAIDAIEEQQHNCTIGDKPAQPNHITLRTQQLDQQWIRITIADDGPGIAESVLQRLFDPFFTTKPVGKGTGMGMSISYQIVTEKHQGRLYCNSALGQGAEFVIEIPVVFQPQKSH